MNFGCHSPSRLKASFAVGMSWGSFPFSPPYFFSPFFIPPFFLPPLPSPLSFFYYSLDENQRKPRTLGDTIYHVVVFSSQKKSQILTAKHKRRRLKQNVPKCLLVQKSAWLKEKSEITTPLKLLYYYESGNN
jgi:hypothetical protein